MLYFYIILDIKKDDSLNPSSSLKVLWKPLTIDFTWIYCTIIIIALSPAPFAPKSPQTPGHNVADALSTANLSLNFLLTFLISNSTKLPPLSFMLPY